MSTKEWLLRAWNIEKEIHALEREKESAKALATSVTAKYDDVKVQTSQGNSTENAILKYIEYENKITERIDELYAVKREIFDAISKVDNTTYRTLLTLRYLQYMTWERIAEEMDLSDKWVRKKLHSDALYEVSNSIK